MQKINFEKLLYFSLGLFAYIYYFLILVLFPISVNAQTSVQQGGTGLSSVANGGFLVGNSQFKLAASSSPTVGSIYATNTNATSSLPRLRVSGAIDLMGEYFTNLTTYVRSLFSGGSGIMVSGGSVSCNTANGSTFGCLTSSDWNTFNGKQNTITTGNLLANSPLSFDSTRQVIGGNATISLGTVPIANGGTNATSQTANTLLWFNGAAITSTGTPQLSVGNILATSSATSTYTGGIETKLVHVTSSTASSTFENGIILNGGCIQINGTCSAGGGGSGTVSSGAEGQLAWYDSNGSTVTGSSSQSLTLGSFNATDTNATSTFLGGATVAKQLGVGLTNPMFTFENNGSASSSSYYMPFTTSANSGVFYLGTSRFFHNYAASSKDGKNTFMGLLAGNLTSGAAGGPISNSSYNSGFGYGALNGLTSGYNNTTQGYLAGYQITTGHDNVALGYSAMIGIVTGNSNTSVGVSALSDITSGSNNVGIGTFAGANNSPLQTALSQVTLVGANTSAALNNTANSTALGYNVRVTKSNQVIIGNSSVTETLLNGKIGINTTAPGATLEAKGGTSDVLNFYDSSSNPLLKLQNTGELGIGTGTPYALISGASGDLITPLLALSSSTDRTLFSVDQKAHVLTGGIAPAVSACGTSPVFVGGNDTNWRLKTGSGGSATTCTLTFANTYTNAPVCNVTQETGTAAVFKASSTPTTIVITAAATTLTSNFFVGHCEGY